jgi:subtilisin-like proprotein convertase family protein
MQPILKSIGNRVTVNSQATIMKNLTTAFALLATLALGYSATAAETQRTNFIVNIDIPDNNVAGIASTRMFSSNLTNILDLNVTLDIKGTYNGDLAAFVSHGSSLSVLLNRVGSTAANPLGYADAGLQIKLDDAASNGDIHTYHLTLGSSSDLTTPLTGTWAPDGRLVDPATAKDTDPRTANLAVFNGTDPNGEWTLFLADMSPGGTSTLISWGLEVTGVPEPSSTLMFALGGFGLLLAWRNLGRRSYSLSPASADRDAAHL